MADQKIKNNKRLYLVIVLCIILVAVFIILNSYAYWKLSEKQSNKNVALSGCLSIRLDEPDATGFTLNNAWPISDEEGESLPGYNFNVMNTCDSVINYQIILDSIEIAHPGNEIDSSYIKIKLDDKIISKYGQLKDAIVENINYHPLESKVIYTGVVPAATKTKNGQVDHNLKIWISEDAPKENISKEFNSKVRVIAGQEIEYAVTPDGCFDFDSETGTVTGYHEEECTTEYLVLPPTINGVTVKSIDFGEDIYYNDCTIEWNYIDLTKAIGLETIKDAFNWYQGEGQNLIIPESVKYIGDSAFQAFNGNDLIIGNNVEYIGAYAFRYYRGKKRTLIIPDSVKTIDRNAFLRFSGQELILGSGIKNLGYKAFSSDWSTKIYINMSEEEFNQVNKNVGWSSNVNWNYLK